MTVSSATVSDTVIVEADHLEGFAARVFEALGMSAEHASLMAEQITWAHVHGHPWLGGRKIMQFGITIRRLLNHNGSCYKSKLWHRTCRGMCIRVKNTRPYTVGRGGMT